MHPPNITKITKLQTGMRDIMNAKQTCLIVRITLSRGELEPKTLHKGKNDNNPIK